MKVAVCSIVLILIWILLFYSELFTSREQISGIARFLLFVSVMVLAFVLGYNLSKKLNRPEMIKLGVLTSLFIVVVFIGTLILSTEIVHAKLMKQGTETTKGVIVEKINGKKPEYRFEYKVNGRSFLFNIPSDICYLENGIEKDEPFLIDKEGEIGKEILVVYNADYPAVHKVYFEKK